MCIFRWNQDFLATDLPRSATLEIWKVSEAARYLVCCGRPHRLTPGSFNNRKTGHSDTDTLDTLEPLDTLDSRRRHERETGSPGCGVRRRSANLVWIPIQRDLIVNPLAPQSPGCCSTLPSPCYTRNLLPSPPPPLLRPRVIINITEVYPAQPPPREAGPAEVEVTALKWGCWW